MGKKTGVGVQLKSKYAPLILQTHCVARAPDKMQIWTMLLKLMNMTQTLFQLHSSSD
jgi:hypothetical protein